MKSRNLILAITFALVTAMTIPTGLAAQDDAVQSKKAQHHHYKLMDIGTFGGPQSFFQTDSGVLNNAGVLAGWSDTTVRQSPQFCFYPGDGFASDSFEWRDSMRIGLPVLPGGTSSQAVWVAPNGLIAGYSQNGQTDPLVGGSPQSRAVLWRDGQAIDLGSLGGNESTAYTVNSHGQVAGVALNDTPDPYSFFDFVFCGSSGGTQTRAFLWDENNGMQDLGTLGSGNDALAFFVNDAGQVAGFGYTNSTPNPATGLPTFHPFVWDKKRGMQDLGSFGGTAVMTLNGFNQRGEVVGTLTLPGDATWHPFLWDGKQLNDLGTFGGDQDFGNWINDAGDVVGQGAFPGDQVFHGFLWSKGKKTDLGLLPGDSFSDTSVINSRRQIVGISGNSTSASAVLWEDGQIFDLNNLIAPDSALTLYWAVYINDRGEIATFAVDAKGNNHDVLLIPCDDNHPNIEGCDYSMVDAAEVVHDAVAPRSLAIPPTMESLERTINPSQNWFRQRYRIPGQRPALRH